MYIHYVCIIVYAHVYVYYKAKYTCFPKGKINLLDEPASPKAKQSAKREASGSQRAWPRQILDAKGWTS